MAVFAPASNGSRKFDSHPEGNFSAVLCDVYALEEVNYFHGKLGTDGKIDDRLTATKLYLSFLTESQVEIEGVLKPRWIRQGFSFSLGKNAKLSAALKGWIKALAGEENLYATFDERSGRPIDSLIGTPAYIEVTHSPNARDASSPYANITKISALPKFNPESGEPIAAVQIPADYSRSDVAKLQENANKRIQEKNPSWMPAAKATQQFKAAKAPKAEKPAATFDAVDDADLPF